MIVTYHPLLIDYYKYFNNSNNLIDKKFDLLIEYCRSNHIKLDLFIANQKDIEKNLQLLEENLNTKILNILKELLMRE